ncbi:NAD(+)/NADH kinase [Pseudomonadales bacterium]|nr:NAD(+)/NADH kinase [Pseudomonadales bacterium]
MNHLGIIVNPMSGRDVRRVAARASTSSHQNKQQQVTRLVLGALANGVDKIYLANEPFRINERAIESLAERVRIEILQFPLSHTAKDTTYMVNAMWDAGCRTFIVLGGDGTSRIVARAQPGAVILPLSTGTNNVFPQLMEASVAGAAAGLICSQQLAAENHCYRCKQLHISVNGGVEQGGQEDTALIDAVVLKNDMLGSLLPFAPENIVAVYLSRAEPASVGMSPIGGYLMPCDARDPFGVFITCGQPATTRVRVPLSPGLYGEIPIQAYGRIEFGQPQRIQGPCILAFDGDRTIQLGTDDYAEITIRNDGPWIIEPGPIMSAAAAAGLFNLAP